MQHPSNNRISIHFNIRIYLNIFDKVENLGYALPIYGALDLGLGTTGLVFSFFSRYPSSPFQDTAPTITGGILGTDT